MPGKKKVSPMLPAKRQMGVDVALEFASERWPYRSLRVSAGPFVEHHAEVPGFAAGLEFGSEGFKCGLAVVDSLDGNAF